ncbi:TetR/AcrR family transcriptional regulator [Pseudomonas capeferrum]|uniref:TetR/AcrR family transcriptional regulator n=1 Tax=Pseudomonas capeferrum TaxID=1495066 RepID=UPI0015E2B235|nr:TetR/AcrR family transcriptional regulator [Pseudomonas capeferrum]MBA1204302.1 TetR/AcrR family transcriptional regulator [Pseudomonas capeferrum]
MSRIDDIRSNAIALIAEHGFGAVSLRQLARSCGLQAGSLYTYYQSKDDLLQDLIASYLEDLQQSWQQRSKKRDNPVTALNSFVAHHLEFQRARYSESLIASMDLRNLSEPHKCYVMALKSSYEQELKHILLRGERHGLLSQDHMTSGAILAMLTGICLWRDSCADDPAPLVQLCQRAAMQIACAPQPAPIAAPTQRLSRNNQPPLDSCRLA